MQVSTTFLAAIQPLLIADRTTIPHFNQDMQDFHMTPITLIFLVKKACSGLIILLIGSPLV